LPVFPQKGTRKVAATLARMLDAELVQIEPLRESVKPGKLLKVLFYKIGD
jgi:hypothetical protein